ncbi:hypothetical protein [Halohasta litorea]|uniref:PGF-CTERM protein n=1 Tax=Halohasta litorea TaxID=869891 RepID=A0ABD6D5J1_9EURY|nr:hypothetical protein [Halohasta litorea]
MSASLRVRRRAVLCTLGIAATGTAAETVAAQQADDGDTANETAPGNDSDPVDDGTEPEPDDRGTATDDETDGEADEYEQDAEPEAFDPQLDLDCYALSVDAETYDSVELRFTDGTTVTFDDGYNGATTFGFSGDGRLDPDAETAIEEFRGPIAWATVIAGEATETVTNSGRCPFADLTFDCDSARFSRGNDVRLRFTDGSVKQWDPPADPDQTQFGSPGRVIESVGEESVDIEIVNPDPDCEPGGYATVFDCTEVTVGPEEFAAEPTFDRAMLTFTDGSTQSFDGPDHRSAFTAPETFAGTGDHVGALIESIGIEKGDGDIAFRLVNPTVDDCEPAPPAEADGDATDDGSNPASDRTEGGSAADTEDGDDARSSPPDTGPETDHSPSSGGLPVVQETIGRQLPWWSGIAAAGGAAGTVSYLVSRTLGETPEAAETSVESPSENSDGSDDGRTDAAAVDDAEAVDETPNRSERFGNG